MEVLSAFNKVAAFIGDDAERRRHARHTARIPFRMPLPEIKSPEANPGPERSLLGFVRDVSSTGMALIVPGVHIGGYDPGNLNPHCRIVLALPTGYVEIRAELVHYQKVSEPDGCYLLGLRITEMSDRDGAIYTKYLGMLDEAVG
jgi:hypothetical protein